MKRSLVIMSILWSSGMMGMAPDFYYTFPPVYDHPNDPIIRRQVINEHDDRTIEQEADCCLCLVACLWAWCNESASEKDSAIYNRPVNIKQ